MTACAACERENPAAAKFCAGCGTPLAIRCPSCEATAQPDAAFCIECGVALTTPTERPSLPAAVAVSGEKKHITVLFADVAGSMDLQERLDAEVWAAIMGRFVSILAEGVRRFGGTVDKFTGDGIMALFGAPVAQEDHARRACHAAWHLTKAISEFSAELRKDHGVELQVRLGLNSGEVVVGRVGDDVTLDPTALGHTVGLAQRMEAMAEPGMAYLTEHTARLVEGWFSSDALGARDVKGASEPLRVHVLGAPQPASKRRTVGAAPLVGRERELVALREALSLAIEGQAQVVGVVGDAGVGKSRLCEEFAQSCENQGITVRRAAGVSHGRDVPLLPILALHREYLGISDTDEPAVARGKVTERLLELDPGLDEQLPLVFDFLEIPDPDRPAPPMAAEVRMRRIFDVIRRVTARRSERETLVLLLEDLHWFDPQSEAFLERMIESYPGSRTLVVTNFRPEFSASWMRHSYYRQLPLAPLREQAVSAFLGGLVGTDLSLAPLVTFVLERTGGNPFFVEEVVRALIEDGTLTGRPGSYRLTRHLHEVRVPPTVQAVVAARIDRLEPEAKALLQTAAVVGRSFSPSLLVTVAGLPGDSAERLLDVLCRAELVQQAPAVSEYRFWHPLTQDVAYQSILADRRRPLHHAVASALTDGEPHRLEERAAVIAAHFESAEEHLEAAQWNARAAASAWSKDQRESVRRWWRTLENLERMAPTDESIRLGVRARGRLVHLATRGFVAQDEANRLYGEGRRLAEGLSDPVPLGMLTQLYGAVELGRGELTRAQSLFREAEHLVETNPKARGVGSLGMTFVQLHSGPLAEAWASVEQAISLLQDDVTAGRADFGYSPLMFYRLSRCELLALRGRLGDALREAEDLIVLAEEASPGDVPAYARTLFPRVSFCAGGNESHMAHAAKAVSIAEELGDAVVRVRATQALGIANLIAHRYDEAIAALTQTLSEARALNVVRWEEGATLAYLARAHLERGDGDAAPIADEAVTVSRRQGARVAECLALVTRLHVRRRLHGRTGDDSVADVEAALRLVRETGCVTHEPLVHEELGRLGEDGAELQEALRLYRQIGATGHAHRLEAELSGSVSAL